MKPLKNLLIALVLIPTISCKTDKKLENKKDELSEFNYTPKKPLNGEIYGVVELGAAGFNSFIINVDKNLNWELVNREFGTSLLVEGMTNAMLINQKLREYLKKIADFGVPNENIHFVVSSGAIKEDITQTIIKELKTIGFDVNTVTHHEEGVGALKSILPKEFEKNAFAVDLGSGNTKISFLNENGIIETLETHGAKYYQKGFEDAVVYSEVREIASKIPIKNRKQCFIIGGVPTEMAKLFTNNKTNYIVLSPDTEKYKSLTNKKVKSGINIFKAIQNETNTKQTIYSTDGNFAIGFLLNKLS